MSFYIMAPALCVVTYSQKSGGGAIFLVPFFFGKNAGNPIDITQLREKERKKREKREEEKWGSIDFLSCAPRNY